ARRLPGRRRPVARRAPAARRAAGRGARGALRHPRGARDQAPAGLLPEAALMDRRTFLRRSGPVAPAGAAGVAAGAGVAGRRGGDGGKDAKPGDPLRASVPFEGRRQAGIASPPAEQATLVALDSIADDFGGLVQAVQTLSSQARQLTTGYSFA